MTHAANSVAKFRWRLLCPITYMCVTLSMCKTLEFCTCMLTPWCCTSMLLKRYDVLVWHPACVFETHDIRCSILRFTHGNIKTHACHLEHKSQVPECMLAPVLRGLIITPKLWASHSFYLPKQIILQWRGRKSGWSSWSLKFETNKTIHPFCGLKYSTYQPVLLQCDYQTQNFLPILNTEVYMLCFKTHAKLHRSK